MAFTPQRHVVKVIADKDLIEDLIKYWMKNPRLIDNKKD